MLCTVGKENKANIPFSISLSFRCRRVAGVGWQVGDSLRTLVIVAKADTAIGQAVGPEAT